MRKILTTILAVSVLVVFTGLSTAIASEDMDPAKALFEEKCSACHTTEKPLGKTKDKDGWTATVKRMQEKKPGHISDEEAAKIIDYLTKTRGM